MDKIVDKFNLYIIPGIRVYIIPELKEFRGHEHPSKNKKQGEKPFFYRLWLLALQPFIALVLAVRNKQQLADRF